MEEPKEFQDEEKIGSVRQWVVDNLRLIISVVIVIALGVTIYSYSQRTKESTVTFEDKGNTQEQVLVDNGEGNASDTEKSKPEQTSAKPETSSAETVKETSDAVIAVAVRGDGTTKLARKALADTLAKNPDSTLTAAHKIYIEDALRKAIRHKGGVHVGTEVSFSKELIQKTIEQSKHLTDRQLKNIANRYVSRVPSLK